MSDLDTIDDLPDAKRPALAAVSTQTIAEHAADAGMLVAQSRPRDPAHAAELAHAAVKAIADRVMPAREADESPGAWYRRGVRDGIMCAWEGRAHNPPEIDVRELELYLAGWVHSSTVVLRVKSKSSRDARRERDALVASMAIPGALGVRHGE